MNRVYAGIIVVLALAAGLGTWLYGHARYDAGVASIQTKLDHQRVEAAFEQMAAIDQVAKRYAEEQANEIPKVAPAIVVALHAGTLQLRDEWTPACPAPGIPDGGADLRDSGAGRLVQIGAACDAQVRGLQQTIDAYRAGQVKRP